jgi:SAM-dependent methyltransferase
VSERVDFSGNAGIYDRRHGAAIPDEALERLWQVAGLLVTARVLDIGAGTGRVAIPLARLGCSVVAVEPAAGMLAQLRAKASDGRVRMVVAEGARLPFPAGSFDAVVIARLLYLTPDWRAILDETHRVLAAGGRLLHEWGNGQAGEEWVQIRDEARRLFEQAGVSAPFHPGVRSEADVDHHVVGLGFLAEGELDMGPGPAISLREFLRRLTEGELSYIWSVPEGIRSESLPKLTRWAEQTFDLERPLPIPREARWSIYRKDEQPNGTNR